MRWNNNYVFRRYMNGQQDRENMFNGTKYQKMQPEALKNHYIPAKTAEIKI